MAHIVREALDKAAADTVTTPISDEQFRMLIATLGSSKDARSCFLTLLNDAALLSDEYDRAQGDTKLAAELLASTVRPPSEPRPGREKQLIRTIPDQAARERDDQTWRLIQDVGERQKAGEVCAIVSMYEIGALTLKAAGVEVGDVLVSLPDSKTQALEIVDTLARTGAVEMIVVLGVDDKTAGEMHGRVDAIERSADRKIALEIVKAA